MLPKAISALLCTWLLFAAAPASAWEQSAVKTAEQLMNGHCVDRNAPNTVYLLNSNSGEYMSEIEERKAMSALAMAFLDHGRFQLTRGETLQYEAYMSENTDAGRRKLQNTMERKSASTLTMFFVPVGRDQGVVYADIVFLARSNEDGETRLGCGTSITVDIQTVAPPPPTPPPPERLEESAKGFVVDYLALWSQPEQTLLSRIMSLYKEPVEFYDESRTLHGIYEEKAAFMKRWPYRRYDLLPNTLSVSCNAPLCFVEARYSWQVSSPDRGEQKSGRSTLTMTLRRAGNVFKIIAEDGDVY